MKYLVIGLGNFGGALAKELTAMGHEIIGVDNNEDRIEELKDVITIPIIMDATQEVRLKSLPLNDCDAIIISIGEDFKSSIHITALIKQLTKTKIISRAFSSIQESIIQAIRVDQIIMPETEAAQRFANTLSMPGIINSHHLDEDHLIAEIKIPVGFAEKIHHLLEEDFPKLEQLAIKTPIQKQSLLRNNTTGYQVKSIVGAECTIKDGDILVVMGLRKEIQDLTAKLNP